MNITCIIALSTRQEDILLDIHIVSLARSFIIYQRFMISKCCHFNKDQFSLFIRDKSSPKQIADVVYFNQWHYNSMAKHLLHKFSVL